MHIQHARRFSRRRFLGGVTLAGMAGLLGVHPRPVAAEPPPETTRLRLGRAPGICGAPLFVAAEFLPGEGFTEVQYVDLRGSAYTKTTAAGEIDFGSNFIGPTLTRLEAGDPLVLLSGTHVGCFEMFAHEQVRTVRDLKGKTMAVGQLGGSEHTFISSILAYVGIDPQKEVHWVTHPFEASTQLFAEGKIDAVAAQPPQSQELRARQIGHVLVNSTVDRPWSQYYCCMVYTHKAFVQQYPVATKRVLRAILKAADLCTSEPERAARFLVDKGYTKIYDYARETMQDVVYRQWRDYDPEDTVRFYALRLQEAGMITSTPQKLIAQGTDWRFFNALKKELKG
ncbi:MAG: ABC transporter substrate-binding protein [Deltaproteobacteria bacterium]|nr:MAG: ABC transporter substrate-binding protein [Deltaproteobacteria bacterium]